MKATQLEAFADVIVKAILAAIDGPLVRGRMEAIESRITAMEAKPFVKFCGVWKTGGTYAPGDAATHQGGLWLCRAATSGEPSKDFVGWVLAVKSGTR